MSRKSAQFPYAKDERTGCVVHISDDLSKCGNLMCIGCETTVFAHKGESRIHHFAHKAQVACGGGNNSLRGGDGIGNESHEHIAAKLILATTLTKWTFRGETCSRGHVEFADFRFHSNDVTVTEMSMGQYRVDVGVMRDQKPYAAIEVWHAHQVEEPKDQFLRVLLAGKVFEVKAEEVLSERNKETPMIKAYHKSYMCALCTEESKALRERQSQALAAWHRKREQERENLERQRRDEQDMLQKRERKAEQLSSKQQQETPPLEHSPESATTPSAALVSSEVLEFVRKNFVSKFHVTDSGLTAMFEFPRIRLNSSKGPEDKDVRPNVEARFRPQVAASAALHKQLNDAAGFDVDRLVFKVNISSDTLGVQSTMRFERANGNVISFVVGCYGRVQDQKCRRLDDVKFNVFRDTARALNSKMEHAVSAFVHTCRDDVSSKLSSSSVALS